MNSLADRTHLLLVVCINVLVCLLSQSLCAQVQVVPLEKLEKASIYKEIRVFLEFQKRTKQGELIPCENTFFWLPHHVSNNKKLLEFAYDWEELPAVSFEHRSDGLHPQAQFMMQKQSLVILNNSDSYFRPVPLAFNGNVNAGISAIGPHESFYWKPHNSPSSMINLGGLKSEPIDETTVDETSAFRQLSTKVSDVFLVVQPHPFGVVSDRDGFATLLVPDGNWNCRIQHPEVGRNLRTILDGEGNELEFERMKVNLEFSEKNNHFTFILQE